MAGKASLSALAAIALLVSSAAGAFASAPQAHTHASKDKLTLNITTTGSTVWGTVKASWKSGGKTTTKACSQSKCTWSLPASAKLKLTQSPLDSQTWPFKSWTVKEGGKTKTSSATSMTVKLTSSKVRVTALYVLAGQQSNTRSNGNGGYYGGGYKP